ncbi:unnamed protein product [Didymodactylos carnosus]|uniref:Antistasin-like domain-containing protein n=2 Tax=Didymodactylos carnosus TaxID=1234261 RepID=A0A814M9K6_9BILA|nr:unnamed protein product [Didymodactylos carnosus]CAF1218673.1 unnamed protein product [Didymodactylos carnosus]CAF3841874.1 unnamed protein product [Didymodactylos carnosus]CAF4026932.1 unnamed protein product [Didymodactylos carnosus]
MFNSNKISLFLVVLTVPYFTSAFSVKPGRCPHAQYASSGWTCSAEGDDSMCSNNYKCCPLTNGMACFEACPTFDQPCSLTCQFGYKVDPSPCETCECADNPCSTTTCPLGTKCAVSMYEPCGIKGRCGLKTSCIDDPAQLEGLDLTPKPGNCPNYWPLGGGGLTACKGPDAICGGTEKCCQAPGGMTFMPNAFENPSSYCVKPCQDLSDCILTCPRGLDIEGGCHVCKCAPDPCATVTCLPGERCELLPTPCAHYPGRPPCPLYPVCRKLSNRQV